jgi:hypothetical protein
MDELPDIEGVNAKGFDIPKKEKVYFMFSVSAMAVSGNQVMKYIRELIRDSKLTFEGFNCLECGCKLQDTYLTCHSCNGDEEAEWERTLAGWERSFPDN